MAILLVLTLCLVFGLFLGTYRSVLWLVISCPIVFLSIFSLALLGSYPYGGMICLGLAALVFLQAGYLVGGMLRRLPRVAFSHSETCTKSLHPTSSSSAATRKRKVPRTG
jgi:hypothetical protein